jgi:hypothetical protein
MYALTFHHQQDYHLGDFLLLHVHLRKPKYLLHDFAHCFLTQFYISLGLLHLIYGFWSDDDLRM